MAFGLPIKIEYRKGSTRTGTGSDGKKWSRVMHADYGHIKKTEGTDGEELDVYIGPHEDSTKVFVVDQLKAPEFKTHDEQKFMLGFLDAASAKKTYLKHYPSPKFFGGMRAMSIDDFKKKVQVEGKSGEKIAQRISRDLDLLLELNLHKLAAGETLVSAAPQVQAAPGLTEALAAVPVMGPDAVPVTRTYPAGGAMTKSAAEQAGRPLTVADREKIKSKNFAIPEAKKYPIHDASHARAALSMVAKHGTPEEQARVRAAVAKKWPGIGSESTKTAVSHRWVHEAVLKAKASPTRLAEFAGKMEARQGRLAAEHPGLWSDFYGNAYEKARFAGEAARGRVKSASDRVTKIEDRIDDVGLGLLATPYIGRGLAKHLAHRKGVLGAVGRAGGAVEHFIEKRIPNRAEVAGLALVAPGIIKPMAKKIDKALPKKPAGGGVMGPGALTGGNDDLARGIGDNSLAKKVAAATVSKPTDKPVPTPQSISASKYAQLEQLLFDLDPAFEYLTEDEKRVKIAGLMGMAGRVSGLASRAATGVKNLGASISHGVQTGVARVRAQGAYDFAKNRALGAGANAMDASSAGLQASQKHLQTALKPPPAKAIPAPAAAAAGMPTTSPSSVTTPGRTPSGTAPGTPAKPLLTVGNIARGALVGGTGLALYGGYKGINAATGLLEREPYYAPAASPEFSQGM